jgi:hypothetical protein
MSTESSTTTARRALESLPWPKTLSRAKHHDLVKLIADAIDHGVADALADLAGTQARIAESISGLNDHGTGESAAVAGAHTRIAQQLGASAGVRRARVTLRTLAAAHPELCFDPDYRGPEDTALQIWLHTYTLDETLTALRAWSRHITDPTLQLDRPEPPHEPDLQLTGHLNNLPITVVGALPPSQPDVIAFLARDPGSADGTRLSLEVLGDSPDPEAGH